MTMCGLKFPSIFHISSLSNLRSQSSFQTPSEKHLSTNRTASTNHTASTQRTIDTDDYNFPQPSLPRYNSAPSVIPSPKYSHNEQPRSPARRDNLRRTATTPSSITSITSSQIPHAITSPQPIHSYAFTTYFQTAPSEREAKWIAAAASYVRHYMRVFDASHDFSHIQRVLKHSMHILNVETQTNPSTRFDPTIVALAALLHDVGDKKYRDKHASLHQRPKRLAFADEEPSTSSSSDEITRQQPRHHHRNHSRPTSYDAQLSALLALSHDDPETLVKRILLRIGCPEELARTVQRIVKNVSYSHEILDPAHVRGVMLRHPELAIVQDADRLDALGALGIGRCFTYGGAQSEAFLRGKPSAAPAQFSNIAGSRNSASTYAATQAAAAAAANNNSSSSNSGSQNSSSQGRSMQDSAQHFEEKLLRLEGMMKTREGKRLARVRTERLRVFRGWWDEEMNGIS